MTVHTIDVNCLMKKDLYHTDEHFQGPHLQKKFQHNHTIGKKFIPLLVLLPAQLSPISF